MLTARQVNLLLAGLIVASFGTGLLSWGIGTSWVRLATAAHGITGFTLLVLAPAKLRKSVATGMRRRRPTRWLSASFGVLVLATVTLGFLHATGLWYGVGYWSALWTHFAVAFVLIPLFIWHFLSRPVRPRPVDLDRRVLVHGSAAVAIGAGVYVAQEALVRATGIAGSDRRATGSHEVASYNPQAMPTVSWIDDQAPDLDVDDWTLRINGRATVVAALRAAATPVVAAVDCTGGWWSEQSWDAVDLASLLGDTPGRSIEVRSATGYARLLPRADAARLYLAVGYGGQPLRRGHGAPVRLVAPGRRGPWWVKWVTEVDLSDRPWWLQLPFPPT